MTSDSVEFQLEFQVFASLKLSSFFVVYKMSCMYELLEVCVFLLLVYFLSC